MQRPRPESTVTIHTHQTAPPQFVEAKGIRFADSRRTAQRRLGKVGGYSLARPAHEITVGHIVRVLDWPLAPVACASKNSYRRCEDWADEQHCCVRLVMLEARNAIATVLDNRTLAEMRALAGKDEENLLHSFDAQSPSGTRKPARRAALRKDRRVAGGKLSY